MMSNSVLMTFNSLSHNGHDVPKCQINNLGYIVVRYYFTRSDGSDDSSVSDERSDDVIECCKCLWLIVLNDQ